MEKFKLNYLHIADGASIDQRGKVSVYGIFERVSLNKIPSKLLKFVVVGSITFGKNTGKNIALRVKIIDLKNQELKIDPIAINFPINEKAKKKGGKIGFTLEVGNLEFKKTGVYKVVVYANKNKVGMRKLKVETRNL